MKQENLKVLKGGPPQLPPVSSPQKIRLTISHFDGITGKTQDESFEGEGVGMDPMTSQGPCLGLVIKVLKGKDGKQQGQEMRFFPYTFIRGLKIEVLG